ncbi:hypothetical protein M9458_018431, partial [Cirrhinus mrigala]
MEPFQGVRCFGGLCYTILQEAAPPECPEGKIYIAQALRQSLLGAAHRSLGSGHPGSQRTLSLLQSRYWWPSMRRDTIRKIGSTTHPSEALVPHWSRLRDQSPGTRRAYPLRWKLQRLFQHLFRHFGLAEEIVSDRGPQFISHVWKAFFKLLGVSVNLSSGYHPQTNGHTERKIPELGRYLRAYCHEDQHSWSRFFPWAEYAQNSLRQDTTGLTPFQCVLVYQPPLFPWTEEPSNVPAVDHWFRESERVWDSAHHHLQRAVRHHEVRGRPQRTSNRLPARGP